MSVGFYVSGWWGQFVKGVKWVFVPQPEHQPGAVPGGDDQNVAMQTFRNRVSSHRSTGRYVRCAPGYDYPNWKPVGTIRDENPPHLYAQTCASLAPYVQTVVESGIEGYQEKMWVGLTGRSTGISRPPTQPPSRLGSREQLLDISRERY